MAKEEIEHKKRKYIVFILLALLVAFLAVVMAQNAQDTADINNVYLPVVNNTDLYPSQRVQGVTYWANDSPIDIYLIFHATGTGASQAFDSNLSINGTVLQDNDFRTAAGVGFHDHWPLSARIPKGANYSVTNSSNVFNIEWREYPILSGKNGTLSVNTTVSDTALALKLNKTSDIVTSDPYTLSAPSENDQLVLVDNVNACILHNDIGAGTLSTVCANTAAGGQVTDGGARVVAWAASITNFVISYLDASNINKIVVDALGIQYYVNGLVVNMTSSEIKSYVDLNMTNHHITNSPELNNLTRNDTYFNGTVFPLSTNFRNDSIVSNNNTLSSLKFNKTAGLTDVITGITYINTTAPRIFMTDTDSTGAASIMLIDFFNSTGHEVGFIGDPSGASTDIIVGSIDNGVAIYAGGNIRVRFYANGSVNIAGLAGSGQDYVCVDAGGMLVRSNAAC